MTPLCVSDTIVMHRIGEKKLYRDLAFQYFTAGTNQPNDVLKHLAIHACMHQIGKKRVAAIMYRLVSVKFETENALRPLRSFFYRSPAASQLVASCQLLHDILCTAQQLFSAGLVVQSCSLLGLKFAVGSWSSCRWLTFRLHGKIVVMWTLISVAEASEIAWSSFTESFSGKCLFGYSHPGGFGRDWSHFSSSFLKSLSIPSGNFITEQGLRWYTPPV